MGHALTNKEKQFIKVANDIAKHRVSNYIIVCLCYIIGIAGAILGILLRIKYGFFLALFFSVVATFVLICTKVYIRVSDLILKLYKPGDINQGINQGTQY